MGGGGRAGCHQEGGQSIPRWDGTRPKGCGGSCYPGRQEPLLPACKWVPGRRRPSILGGLLPRGGTSAAWGHGRGVLVTLGKLASALGAGAWGAEGTWPRDVGATAAELSPTCSPLPRSYLRVSGCGKTSGASSALQHARVPCREPHLQLPLWLGMQDGDTLVPCSASPDLPPHVSHSVFRACQQIPTEPFLALAWPEYQPRAPRSPLCS